jgi:insulysin
MRCLLISDSEADKCAVSLDVNVGCSLDEEPFLGTAHLLEHMLFLGSSKYPEHSYFLEFIKKNGGKRNGMTSLTNTNYFFDVSNEAFPKALDIFAQFFISPLLEESMINREMQAVDSEFNMVLWDDSWRKINLL